jgi:hypothetical protein
MQRQMSGRGGPQRQLYTVPQQGLPQYPNPLQQYLQQSALQAQMNSTTALMAQLNGGARLNVAQTARQPYGAPANSDVAGLFPVQNVPGKPSLEEQGATLQARLDALSAYIDLEQQAGQLTKTQLRSLRERQAALTKRLKALQERNGGVGAEKD